MALKRDVDYSNHSTRMTEEPVHSPAPPTLAEALPAAAPLLHLDRADRLAFALAALPALLVYLATLPPEVTLEFSGIDATAAYYGSASGPPGYPVWSLYSWVFVKLLPFSNIAWRVTVGSAVAGALACGIVAMLISFMANVLLKGAPLTEKLSRREWQKLRVISGVAASLVLGFNGTFWSCSVIAEPWGFAWMLFAGTLWFLTRAALVPPGRAGIWIAFLFFGMMHTGNQELLIALPGFVLLLMASDVRLGRDLALFFLPLAFVLTLPTGWNELDGFESVRENWPMAAAFAAVFVTGVVAAIVTRGLGGQWKSTLVASLGLVAGMAFYLYLPLAGMTTPPVQWGYPRTVEGFLHLISRGQYERAHATGSFGRYAEQLWNFFWNTGDWFGWLYLGIALVGAVMLARAGRRSLRWLIGLAAVWVCTGPLLLAMLNPSPDRQSHGRTAVFLVPTLMLLAVLMGFGLVTIGAWVARWGKEPEPAAPPPKCASS